MADLISQAHAKQFINDASFSSAEDDFIDDLIDGISAAIRKYCRRQFDSQSFDELHDGNGQELLLLREFPIISVARVAYAPETVLEVSNTSSANQRATVQVGSTGITLTRVASGSSSSSSPDFATYPTLTTLAAAIIAVGSGWTARVVGSNTLRASADLYDPHGALNAKDVWAPLKIHTSELSDYNVNASRGWLRRGGWTSGQWEDDRGCWDGGPDYWRVIYTAGYATVPEDVQTAAGFWVAELYEQAKTRDKLQSTVVPSSGDTKSWNPTQPMPKQVKALLDPHRKRVL